MNSILLAITLLVMGMLLVAELRAAEPTSKPAPAVIVLKTDGSRVRGTIQSADRDGVVILPSVKPKDPPADAVTLSWKEIKNISNGLTQAKATAHWKGEHHDELCEKCDGNGVINCETCKGTGHDPASGKDCKTCKGELLVACKTPKCKDGKMPCTMPCLKLSEGNWITKGDTRWRRFPMRGGETTISEHHLGELISVDPKSGQIINNGKCPTCGGTTLVKDEACHGTGKIPCPACTNRPNAPACPAACDHGKVKCSECDGTGLKPKAKAA